MAKPRKREIIMKSVNELPVKLKVRVTKTNIRRGKKGNSDTCAVSRAVRTAIQAKRNGMTVDTGGGTDIEVWEGGDSLNRVKYIGVTAREQKRIDDFINNFDDKKSKVKPCTFRLKLEKDWA